jgi:ATP-dependent Zn protease
MKLFNYFIIILIINIFITNYLYYNNKFKHLYKKKIINYNITENISVNITENISVNIIDNITHNISDNIINNITHYISDNISNLLKIAYHESGHATSIYIFKKFYKIIKVSIAKNNFIETSYTLFKYNNYSYNYQSKEYLLINMIIALSGYVSELIFLNLNSKNLYINKKKELLYNLYHNIISTSSDIFTINKILDQYLYLYGNTINNKLTNIERYILTNYIYNKTKDLLIINKKILVKILNDLLYYKTLNSSYFNNL